MRAALFIVVALAACGGGSKPEPASPASETSTASSSSGDTQVPMEKVDEIQRLLDRKQSSMSRCLSFAVDNKELPPRSRGRATVELSIAPSGKATEVKIVKSTLESKSLSDCIISNIEKIQFPELPKSFVTSYTYAFEAM